MALLCSQEPVVQRVAGAQGEARDDQSDGDDTDYQRRRAGRWRSPHQERAHDDAQTRTAQNGEEERRVGLHPHDAQAVACRGAHVVQTAGLLRALDGS